MIRHSIIVEKHMAEIDPGISEGDIKEEQGSLTALLANFRWPLTIALIGALLVGIGTLVFFWPKNQDKIEIISPPTSSLQGQSGSRIGESDKKIWVDIAGAVEEPGVYQLNPGSRVNDLLIVAGGISAQANRNWVDLHLNRAQTLTDGIKIYIPFQQDPTPPLSNSSSTQGIVSASSTININTASKAQLESLWGIGPVTADKIISNRPFSRPEELLEKKIIKSNVWTRIKDQITVY